MRCFSWKERCIFSTQNWGEAGGEFPAGAAKVFVFVFVESVFSESSEGKEGSTVVTGVSDMLRVQ